MGFAVVDVETTGLDPQRNRIIDVGIVLLNSEGVVEGEWQSLVNPGVPVEATFVHGLSDADVTEAPSFTALLPQIIELLAGRAIVAHNARFDAGFLNAAFARAHYPVTIPPRATVCTMELAKIYLPRGRHGLVPAAERAGIVLSNHHRALPDARTAAALLAHYLDAETRGMRFATEAVSRTGERTMPASWVEAQLAALTVPWIEPLTL